MFAYVRTPAPSLIPPLPVSSSLNKRMYSPILCAGSLLTRARVTVAGACVAAAANLLLILLVGWHDERTTYKERHERDIVGESQLKRSRNVEARAISIAINTAMRPLCSFLDLSYDFSHASRSLRLQAQATPPATPCTPPRPPPPPPVSTTQVSTARPLTCTPPLLSELRQTSCS